MRRWRARLPRWFGECGTAAPSERSVSLERLFAANRRGLHRVQSHALSLDLALPTLAPRDAPRIMSSMAHLASQHFRPPQYTSSVLRDCSTRIGSSSSRKNPSASPLATLRQAQGYAPMAREIAALVRRMRDRGTERT